MGQLEIYNTLKNINSIPKLQDFKIISLLGKGGFSQVKKVKYFNPYITCRGNNDEFLAMKQMSKKRIIELNCIENIFQERDILLNLYNNNIINIYCTFQDKNNIYMIMDYLPGKDLRNLIKNNKNRNFKENEIIFLAACIISGLEYIHSNNIIHRDIKPENLLFDSKFFLRIGDFGVAVKKNSNFKNDNIGTLSYMAPERIGFFENEKNNCKYSFESDFYSLGIILYELCMKKKPFESCKSKKEMIENFSKIKNIKIVSEFYSQNLCDLINKLLIFDPTKRIGYNNIEEIKSHPAFSSFHWKNLTYRTMKNPILEENNDIIIKTKENLLLNSSEEYKDDSFEINEEMQEKFKDYSCIHKLNISDILGTKIILRNNNKASSLTVKSQKKIKILKEMKSFDNNIYQSEKKLESSNNYYIKKEFISDKKTNLKKNLFNNKFILPKLGRKMIKNISNINLNMRYKLEENTKSNSLIIKEDNLNDCIYNNNKNNLVIKNNNNRRKDKFNNAPFIKRESSKLKNIFHI